MLYSRIEVELSNLRLDDIHTVVVQDFDYLYSNSSVFANKPFSGDKSERQKQIIEKHASAIERYIIRKASMHPTFTLMMDIYKEQYINERKELMNALETDASNFYPVLMVSEDGPLRDTGRYLYTKTTIISTQEPENIPPEKLFYTYDETIFKMPYPLRFDEILNTVRLENGKVYKKALEVIQEHENQ
jgi:hypothetical protein